MSIQHKKIISTFFVSLFLHIVIATEKYCKPRLSVNNKPLNQRMEPNLFCAIRINGINELGKEKITFLCRYGTLQVNIMPFSMINTPSAFQRVITMILGDTLFVWIYVNDNIVSSSRLDAHLRHLQQITTLVAYFLLNRKHSKCWFLQDQMVSLRYIINEYGFGSNPEKIKIIPEAPHPTSATEFNVLWRLHLCRRF